MEKLLYTRKDAARILSISEDTLDDLRRGGKISGYHIDKCNPRIYFKPDALADFVKSLEVAKC